MSQAYGRMYHPHPHQHHSVHNQGPPFRQAGEVPQHHHPGYSNHRGYHQNHYSPPPPRPVSSHSTYNNSVSVYSVPKPSRPYNNYNNRRGRGGGGGTGRGGYHNHTNYHNNHHHTNHPGYSSHAHNSYRPHPPDFDLEWDHYDFNEDGPAGKRGDRPKNSHSQQGGGAALNDAELEWDDYDLRPKEEVEEDTPDTLDYILTEGVFPLIGVVTKAPLSRGHIPLGAIQVCRFPQGGTGFKALASSDHLSKSLRLNKELLILTSELNEGALFSTGRDSPTETKDYLLADLALTRDKDSTTSQTDSPSKDGESEGASNGISEEDLEEDLLNEAYESGYQDRLGDIDLYALAPHDFDSPDSTFSRSLADLTEISLYEELGIDPSLLRLGLERSRSLGDATRAQDVSKDRILKGVKTKKRKRKGSEKVEESSLVVGGDEGSEKKTKRLAPNFFVAVQVSNPQIHDSLKDVQQTVVSGDEKLKDAMVPIATLHLTIMVMHLATEEDVERAKVALNECHRLLSPRFMKEKLSILFGGLGHFNNQVMFAKIKDQDNILEILYEIADTVEKCFSEYQLVSTGERGFKPHLTVMKLSRAPSLRKKGVRRIKSELYKTHSGQVFGTQVVEGLQLCSINKPKTSDGYYCKAAEVMFGEPTSRRGRDIHTIAEGEEPSIQFPIQSNGTTNTPEPSDTRPSLNGTMGTEEQTEVHNGGLGVKTPGYGSPEGESSMSDENRNVGLDVKHQAPSLSVCDSAVDCEESASIVAERNDSHCATSDNTQNASSETTNVTSSITTCDTPSVATQDTPSGATHDIPSDTTCDTTRKTHSDATPNTSDDTTHKKSSTLSSSESSQEQVNQMNSEQLPKKHSTDSRHQIESIQRNPTDVSQPGPSTNC